MTIRINKEDIYFLFRLFKLKLDWEFETKKGLFLNKISLLSRKKVITNPDVDFPLQKFRKV